MITKAGLPPEARSGSLAPTFALRRFGGHLRVASPAVDMACHLKRFRTYPGSPPSRFALRGHPSPELCAKGGGAARI